MFRCDKLTVKREVYKTVRGEAVLSFETVQEDIPCHLSVNLTSSQKQNEIPYLFSEFILFMSDMADVKPDDILLVETSKGQKYELIAGEIKIYGLTVQIKCRQKRIIESNDIKRY